MSRAVFPPCGPETKLWCLEIMKIMATSFKRSQAPTTTLSGTNPEAGHRRPTPPFWDSWTLIGKSGSVSCGVTAPSPGSWCTQGFISALQESVSPVLCKFWQLYSEVNDDLLQEGLCHTQVCCTQNPCPLWQATADLYLHRRHSSTQRQVWFSLCGVSWCVQGFVWALRVFGPYLWQVWGLILNVVSPLLPSCWGFSFAIGHGVSFFGGIHHFSVDGCSAASYNFGVLTGEDELTSFYTRTKTQKRYPFHYRGLECKSKNLRDTWSNRQIWPWSTKWSRSKVNSFAKKMYWS